MTAPADKLTFTPEQEQLLRDGMLSEFTKVEQDTFIETCKRSGLDPFRRQIAARAQRQFDKGKCSWQTVMLTMCTIDGFRSIAARNVERYAGQDGPYWCGDDGVWKDVWLGSIPPKAAKVGVYLHGCAHPVTAVALWDNYVQVDKDEKPGKFWRIMGPTMIAKCAEALALRRALPEDLSGLYTADEMAQAGNPDRDEKPAARKLEKIGKRMVDHSREYSADSTTVAAEPTKSIPKRDDEPEVDVPGLGDEADFEAQIGELADRIMGEQDAALSPENPDGLEDLRVWPNVHLPPWKEWCNDKCAEKGQLNRWTHAELVQGQEGGGRHSVARAVIQATRAKYSEQLVPDPAARLDYSLAVMERRYRAENGEGW